MRVKNQNKSKRLTAARLIGSIRLKAPTRLKKPVGATRSLRFPWPLNARTTGLVTIGLAAAALLIAVLLSSPGPRGGDATVEPQAYNLESAVQAEAKKTSASKAPAAAAAARTSAARSSRPSPRAAESIKSSTEELVAVKAAPVEANPATVTPSAAPVTITGCLELDDETFRLKDTAGNDAPKSRSWRSGFFKKRSTSVALVDAASTLRLPHYVGQRVAATGLLVNREMHVRSLQRVASACS